MNKKLKYGILISIVLLTIIVFISKGTYSATTSYSGTRKNLQDMVIATALSYYYNQNYSDYEQYPMDDYYNSDGDINMEDALNLLKYVIDKRTNINEKYMLAGDMDDNNAIKANDIVRLLNEIK